MGGLLGPVHTGLLPAKSAFSVKENTFGVGFKVRRPPAKQQCPRSQRQPRPSLAPGYLGEKAQTLSVADCTNSGIINTFPSSFSHVCPVVSGVPTPSQEILRH